MKLRFLVFMNKYDHDKSIITRINRIYYDHKLLMVKYYRLKRAHKKIYGWIALDKAIFGH